MYYDYMEEIRSLGADFELLLVSLGFAGYILDGSLEWIIKTAKLLKG